MKEFKKHKYWYKKTRKALKNKYGKNYKFFVALLSSTSPRYDIKRNYSTALNIYNLYMKNKNKVINDFLNDKENALKEYKILYAHYNNILKALLFNWKSHKKFKLSGLKVNAFYNNLIGNYHFVTLDVWMIRYFKHDKDYLNISDYKKYTRIIQKASKKFKMLPCEFQAIIWEKTKTSYGFKPLNFTKFI